MRLRIVPRLLSQALALAVAAAACPVGAQAPLTPVQMVSAQQRAMASLKGFNGIWRGEGWVLEGERKVPETVTQRVGPFLDGAAQAVETRSFHADGSLSFHAFNTIAYDARAEHYVMQARAGGLFGNFPFRVTQDGYVWDLGFEGRGLRYTATLKGGLWRQITERITPDQPPLIIGDFTLRRLSDTDWPEGGALKP